MNLLKGLALGILSFFLVLSLSLFGVAFLVNQTILNPSFVSSEINKLDVPLIAEEILSDYIPEEELVVEVLSDTITDLEPWIQEQVTDGVSATYDYLSGRSESLSVVIPLEPVKESLKENLEEVISLLLPPAEAELYLDELYDQIDDMIPATYELNEASLGTELLAPLEMAREYIGYFQLGYKLLIGFMVLLIVGIVLIDHQVRSATRRLGSILLPEGVLLLVGYFIAKYFAGRQLAQFDVPSYLEDWLPQLASDFAAPLLMLSIGLIIGGAVLLTISFVYKRQA